LKINAREFGIDTPIRRSLSVPDVFTKEGSVAPGFSCLENTRTIRETIAIEIAESKQARNNESAVVFLFFSHTSSTKSMINPEKTLNPKTPTHIINMLYNICN
jgi:hypothetical protein